MVREHRNLGKILHGWVSRGAGGMVPWETLETQALLMLISTLSKLFYAQLCELLWLMGV